MLARLIAAAAATTLLVGAAHAQSNGPVSPSQAAAQNATGSWTGPLGDSSPVPASSASAAAAASASTLGADASVTASAAAAPMPSSTVTVSTVTNGPVPDTAENRAKYGAPMSRAGKMTRAAGN